MMRLCVLSGGNVKWTYDSVYFHVILLSLISIGRIHQFQIPGSIFLRVDREILEPHPEHEIVPLGISDEILARPSLPDSPQS